MRYQATPEQDQKWREEFDQWFYNPPDTQEKIYSVKKYNQDSGVKDFVAVIAQRQIDELTRLLAEERKKAVPEGWKAVPIRATQAQWLAGQDVATYEVNGELVCMSGQQVERIYDEMLSAAPKIGE